MSGSRKVVQITAFGTANDQHAECGGAFLYALCEDGTIWEKPMGYPWFQIEAIPQTKAITAEQAGVEK